MACHLSEAYFSGVEGPAFGTLQTSRLLKGFKHTCDCFKLQEEKYRAIFPYTTP